MYKLELSKERLSTYVTGLDSSIKLICNQIAQAQSSGLILKQLFPVLININNELDALQKTVTEAEMPPKEEATILPFEKKVEEAPK